MTKSVKKLWLNFEHAVIDYLIHILAKLFSSLLFSIAFSPLYRFLVLLSTLRWTSERKRDVIPFNKVFCLH